MEYQGQQFRFRAGARLGQGGMAEVYLGTRSDAPDEYAALKVPLPGLLPADSTLFLREAEAASRVSSPYVVRVLDWGDFPPFIAFEYIQGETFDKILNTRRGERQFWTEAELVRMFMQLSEAMHAINEQVIHRDVKPANIFAVGDLLKVSDFGIAKYVGEVTRSRTFKGWGTLPYMAPETLRSDSIDARADQYAMGVVFYELATLQRPFEGEEQELVHKHLYERPGRITSLVNVSERLATFVGRMLEKQRDTRFPSWVEVLNELRRIQEAQPITGQAPLAEDPLVSIAAQQLELVRSRALEQQRAQDEYGQAIRERAELLEYWARELFGAVEDRAAQMNQSLGPSAIRVSSSGNAQSARVMLRCVVSFLDARFELALQPVPPEGPEDMLGWGMIDLRSNRRRWLANLYLSPAPTPYGCWYQMDLEIRSGMRAGTVPGMEDKGGGSYEVAGPDRIVLAKNWQALAFQRGRRHVMGLVQFSEKPFVVGALLDELMRILVEDGGAEPPPGLSLSPTQPRQ